MSVLLSVPYDIDGVPHRVWMKSLWMARGDARLARRLARLIDESAMPVIEDAEKTLGSRVTARILLEKGLSELLAKVETRQLGRLPRVRRRRKNTPAALEIPIRTSKEEAQRQNEGQWLGLCGPDQVTWTINGVRVGNDVIAEHVLRDAAEEGIIPPVEEPGDGFPLLAAGRSEPEGFDIAAFVRSHLRYCGRLPSGATYLGTIQSEEDVKRATEMQGSFVVRDGNDDWLLFTIRASNGQASSRSVR